MDICERKHKRTHTSVTANSRVRKDPDRDFILRFILENGTGYSKQLKRVMGKESLSQISGRFSELQHKLKVIEETGETAEGCRIFRIVRGQMSLFQ